MRKSILKFGLAATLGASLLMTTSCKKEEAGEPCPPDVCGPGGITELDLLANVDMPGVESETKFDTVVARGNDAEDQTAVIITCGTNKGVGSVTLEDKYTYVLNGKVFVNSGETLTIEAGTVIKGSAGIGEAASALVVARGGKIDAQGLGNQPIIFTAISDGVFRTSAGSLFSGTLTKDNPGLWGGVIVLGNAGLSGDAVLAIEGLSTDDDRSKYGNATPVNDDNSGVLKYVSIRHGGALVAADNEINGLTLGGVGSGTTIDYVEVFANKDDGIEWFGGTVNVKHAVVAYCGDDSFDYDQGYRGKGQYWLTLGIGDRGGEHDGGPSDCESCAPYATPTISNVTFIGTGDNRAITFRDNAGGYYSNAVFVDFENGIDIEKLGSGEDSRNRLEEGDLTLDNITFDNVQTDFVVSSEGVDLSSQANVSNINTSGSTGITVDNPVPATKISGATVTSDEFFELNDFQGAFNGFNWALGWTKTYGN